MNIQDAKFINSTIKEKLNINILTQAKFHDNNDYN